tara:strand:- start:26440 stop:27294 length:855 start_codon:yes stop_codon:yes gene_type:complete
MFFFNLFKSGLVKIVLFIQFCKYRLFKKKYSKDRIELFKHFLNFYSFNLNNRSPLDLKTRKYSIGISLDESFFSVDIDKFTGYEGYFTFNNIAPLYKSALEIYENPNLRHKDSYLWTYFKNFKPKNYGELYKLRKENSLYNLPSYLDFKPWINSKPEPSELKKGLFGPADENEIIHRLLRLKNIFINVKRFGYVPTEVDIIKGYFLLSKSDYRFLITSGHHRVAILKAINYKELAKYKFIQVKLEKSRSNIKIVEESKIDLWPAVRSKFCSIQDALEIFEKFFN